MGLLDKLKKEKRGSEEKQHQEQQFQQSLLQKTDLQIRPGGVFMVQLLMKEKCEMPSNERFTEILSKHLGKVEQYGDRKVSVMFAAHDYISEMKDASLPVTLMISDCEEFVQSSIDDFRRSQMWNCMSDRDQILSECKYQIFANDMLGGGLPAKKRANMLMDYLEALVELYPQCEAVYNANSGKLIKADEIRKKEMTGIDRFIRYALNVRFFNVEGTKDSVVDTLGLSLLYIEDLQYHFHDMDPNWVVGHAYTVASYLLNNDNPMKDGDTVDGIRKGMIVQDIQWKCQYEDALIQPARVVIDVCMDEYAAGNRE
mgnify:CR=1 FL=1